MAKKYYWLKLKNDFFDDDTIKYIEEQENGIKYSNFYLKLCLKSVETKGKLIRLVGETLIPYDVKSLSTLTGVDFDTVDSAMRLFNKLGVISFLDNGELYLNQIDELIGSETDKAPLMRRKRAEEKLNGNNVTKMLPHIDIDIEKDIDIDIKKDISAKADVQSVFNTYNSTCTKLPKANKLTDKRKQAIKKFLKEFTVEEFNTICVNANNTEFYTGKNDRKWRADFDFLIRPDKAVKLLEIKESNKPKSENWGVKF